MANFYNLQLFPSPTSNIISIVIGILGTRTAFLVVYLSNNKLLSHTYPKQSPLIHAILFGPRIVHNNPIYEI